MTRVTSVAIADFTLEAILSTSWSVANAHSQPYCLVNSENILSKSTMNTLVLTCPTPCPQSTPTLPPIIQTLTLESISQTWELKVSVIHLEVGISRHPMPFTLCWPVYTTRSQQSTTNTSPSPPRHRESSLSLVATWHRSNNRPMRRITWPLITYAQ